MSEHVKNILEFAAEEVAVLLEHSRRCAKHQPSFDQLYDPKYRFDGKVPTDQDSPTSDDVDLLRIPWGLSLVADDGVYLISSGLPRDIITPDTRNPENGRSRVAYAKGINPELEVFDTWWDRKRYVCGVDDQVVPIDGEALVTALSASGEVLKIRVSNNGSYITSFSLPK